MFDWLRHANIDIPEFGHRGPARAVRNEEPLGAGHADEVFDTEIQATSRILALVLDQVAMTIAVLDIGVIVDCPLGVNILKREIVLRTVMISDREYVALPIGVGMNTLDKNVLGMIECDDVIVAWIGADMTSSDVQISPPADRNRPIYDLIGKLHDAVLVGTEAARTAASAKRANFGVFEDWRGKALLSHSRRNKCYSA